MYALPEEVVTADAGTTGSGGKNILLERGDKTYLALGLILNYTDVRMNVYDSATINGSMYRIPGHPLRFATVKTNGKLRVKEGVKARLLRSW